MISVMSLRVEGEYYGELMGRRKARQCMNGQMNERMAWVSGMDGMDGMELM